MTIRKLIAAAYTGLSFIYQCGRWHQMFDIQHAWLKFQAFLFFLLLLVGIWFCACRIIKFTLHPIKWFKKTVHWLVSACSINRMMHAPLLQFQYRWPLRIRSGRGTVSYASLHVTILSLFPLTTSTSLWWCTLVAAYTYIVHYINHSYQPWVKIILINTSLD